MSEFHIDAEEVPGSVIMRLFGVIDEHADLDRLVAVTSGELRLDLENVRRINSFGVRAWIEVMQKLSGRLRVVFERCSPPVVEQCNMVAGFVGPAAIESFYVPLICEKCDEELLALLSTAACRALGGELPKMPCPRCARPMELDDLEEHYLLFLREEPGNRVGSAGEP